MERAERTCDGGEYEFRYLFAYEDLSKKLGTMNAPNTYFGGRTSMSADSRRSLVRVRQQSEEKRAIPIKQQVNRLLFLRQSDRFLLF